MTTEPTVNNKENVLQNVTALSFDKPVLLSLHEKYSSAALFFRSDVPQSIILGHDVL